MAKKKTASLEGEVGKAKRFDFSWLIIVLCVLAAFGGVYFLILQRSAEKEPLDKTQQGLFLEDQGFEGTKLVIPKISVSEPIGENAESLKQGVWHRFPQRGNPYDGGNMILAGHRYEFAWLPNKVVENSRLFNLDKVEVGDSIYINWAGKQYEYIVKEKKTVSPNESAIEAESSTPKLTLYTCTLQGAADGRVVLIAEPK